MATYLQGVTDYIPDYQPFQPDLNFYGNLLQAKQTQYDTNWKQLNNLYGQLYGAELTHDMNIKKKDELLKQIDFNLRRVSGLDLSLEQNVNQAMQVFRPFYEDKYLMKDMAWTKNWTNTYNSSNALKTSQDENQRKQWWSTGIQGLELRRQMFKDATLDETLTMQNAQYTPFVNTLTEYLDLTKKYNLDKYQTIPDPTGLYLVKRKNGELILPSLQNIFAAEYANRPDIQDMYREQAFVERMSYAYQNAERFGGSKLESEKDYIRNKMSYIKSYVEKRNTAAQDRLNNAQNLQGQLEQNVKSGNVNPRQNNYSRSLEELYQINSTVANETEKLNNQINDNQATYVSQGYQDDENIGDIELARLKVDAGYASIAAEQDILAAASFYADATSSIEYKPNPVGLEFLRHQHALQRDALKAEARSKEIDKIATNKLKEMKIKNLLESNYIDIDPHTGEIDWDPQNNGFNLVTTAPGDPGQSTSGTYTFDVLQTMFKNDQIDQYATRPVSDLMNTIQMGVTQNKFSAYELATIVKTFKSTDPLAAKILKEGSKDYLPDIKKVWESIFSGFTNDTKGFVRNVSKNGQIYATNDVINDWSVKHSGDDFAQKYFNLNSRQQMQDNKEAAQTFALVGRENNAKIRAKLKTDLEYITQSAAKNNPNVVYDQARIDAAVDRMMYRYAVDGNGHNEEFNQMAAELDEEISSILGFKIGKKTNVSAEADWLNYLIPMTYAFKGDREDVASGASWTKDVFDNSFEELTVLHPDKGGLTPYFTNYVHGGARDQYGIAAETQMMKVASGVRMDPGNQAAVQLFDLLPSINFNTNNRDFRITTKGNILPADPEDETGITQAEAMAIVNRLALEINGPDSKKLGNFYISSSDIAMENGKLGSMTIRAPRSIIEEVISEKLDGGDNLIKSYVDNIYQNGITFIAPNEYFQSNPLFSKSMPTPTESRLKHEKITYNDPLGGGSYTIERTAGSGNYLISGHLFGMDEDGNKISKMITWPVDKTQGRLIDEKKHQFYNQILATNMYNFEMFKKIHQGGDPVKIQNAEKNFGADVNKPNWNYNE